MASRTTYCNDFSPSRMRQLAWWLNPTGQSISHQSCDGSIGCLRRRIEFKLALLIYKSLNGSTPRSLSHDCQLVSDVGRCRLCSSDVPTCVAPRGAPDPDPDPAGYPVNFVDPVWIRMDPETVDPVEIRIRPDTDCLDPAGIRIRLGPKSPDPDPAGSYLNTTNTE